MIVSYSDDKVIKGSKAIFLAGPTIRKEQQEDWTKPSWRKEALKILDEIGYDGIVYVPEYSSMRDYIDKDEQFEWEWEALHNSDLVVFWVPRRFPDLPAMSTNVEFGFYITQKPILYGRPVDADKNGYLDKLYNKYLMKEPYKDLKSLLQSAVNFINKR